NGGQALAEILFGTVNPSGKLPFTWEKRIEDNPAFATFPLPLNQKPPNPTTIQYSEGYLSATGVTKRMESRRSFLSGSACHTRALLIRTWILNPRRRMTTAKDEAKERNGSWTDLQVCPPRAALQMPRGDNWSRDGSMAPRDGSTWWMQPGSRNQVRRDRAG